MQPWSYGLFHILAIHRNRALIFFLLTSFCGCGKVRITYNLSSSPFLSVQSSGIQYIHTFVPPSPPSVPRTLFNLVNLKLYLLHTDSPPSSPPAPPF